MNRSYCYFCVLLGLSFPVQSQERKNAIATPIESPLTLDGKTDEAVYRMAKPADGFLQIEPYNGQPAMQRTSVYFFFDHSAMYIGAILTDKAPDSIAQYLSERDDLGLSDYFGVLLDPYNQGQVAYGFFVTPAGTQMDEKAIKGSFDYEDSSWDAVWQSKTQITDSGWTVEMRIPWSALRFPKNGGSVWGVNMFRNIRRYNSNNSWNFIDRNISGFIHQEGTLMGITGIRPPVRLSLSPFAAVYNQMKTKQEESEWMYKGGMDLKYGLSESYTLDMMLIPDFGQIQSDDKQLNLSPYELYYAEKRQFFTEGTELFDRAGIFYSRRIGAGPKFTAKAFESVLQNESVVYCPSETQLLNATKVSGRSKKGLGIGVLNAMTLPSYSTIRDSVTREERKKEVQPFSNYNVIVADQSLKNNSFVSLINTNLCMIGSPFRANVTATDFQIRNKQKTIAARGKGGISYRSSDVKKTGFFSELGFEKNSGKFQGSVFHQIYSDRYNPNDMGFLHRNNEMITRINLYFHQNQPFSVFKEWHSSAWFHHNRSFKPSRMARNDLGISTNATFRNNHGFQFVFHGNGNGFDFYEPRTRGRYYQTPALACVHLHYWTNRTKPFSISGGINTFHAFRTDLSGVWLQTGIQAKLGRRYSFSYEVSSYTEKNNRGFACRPADTDSIFFTRRDTRTITNVIQSGYMINAKTSISARIRHYWSTAHNKEFYLLEPDGKLSPTTKNISISDENFNTFNIDLSLRWIFAPGSELTLAWKNAIVDWRNAISGNLFDNLSRTWQAEQSNSISLRMIYHLDYNRLRSKNPI